MASWREDKWNEVKWQSMLQRLFKAYVTSSIPMLRRTFWRMSFRPCSDKINRLLLNEAQTDNNSDTLGRDIPMQYKTFIVWE